jgi:hypothetical protein
MTIRLTNANGVALTGAAFTDTFPANLALATPTNLTTTCGGTVTGAAGDGGAARGRKFLPTARAR